MSNKEFIEEDTVWYYDDRGGVFPATVAMVEGDGRYFIRLEQEVWGGSCAFTVSVQSIRSRQPGMTSLGEGEIRPEAWIEQVFQNMEG